MEFLGWSLVLSGISKGYSKKAQNSREVHTFPKSMSSIPFPSPICFSSGIAQYCQRFLPTGFLSEQSFPSLSMSCSSAVIHYFVVFHKVSSNCSSVPAETLLWLLIPFRVTFSHFVFGLPAAFFLPVGFAQDFDYFPLRATTSSYLSSRSHKRCSISNMVTNFHFVLPFYLICWKT